MFMAKPPRDPGPKGAPASVRAGASAAVPLATRQRIAQRMSQLLQVEIGTGVEVRRMLAQPLYARDVLLVCDAMRGSELAGLARQYRDAEAAEAAAEAELNAPPSEAGSLWPESRSGALVGSLSRWPRTWFRNSRGGKPK
jgi:hypothetical protein